MCRVCELSCVYSSSCLAQTGSKQRNLVGHTQPVRTLLYCPTPATVSLSRPMRHSRSFRNWQDGATSLWSGAQDGVRLWSMVRVHWLFNLLGLTLANLIE